jgi:hypothetical protein
VTAETLAKRQTSLEAGPGGRDRNCPPVVKVRTASTLMLAADCSIEGHPMHMDMKFEVKSPTETYTEISNSGTTPGGQTSSKASAVSRWIGADCGDVKPR